MGNLWKPPDKVENPYEKSEILQPIVEFNQPNPEFIRAYFEPLETDDPYITPLQHQKITGTKFSHAMYEDAPILEDIITNSKKMLENVIDKKFATRSNGIFLINQEAEDKHLCNFSFKIVAIREIRNRDGSTYNQVDYIVQGSNLIYRYEEVQHIEEKFYDKIFDEILEKYKECYILPECRNIARDYLKEYAAHIYSDFRQKNQVLKSFSYHGWELVYGKWTYLSNSSDDCTCKISIPKVIADKYIWLNDLEILDIGKQIYLPDGSINFIESLKVSLPFFLYLHLGPACKLFLDAGLKVQFILVLIGKTGSFKTTICEIFALPFFPDGMLRFESTAVALENYREQCIDLTMVVDDIFKNDISSIKKFEDINRAFGDGIGRAKATGKDYKENLKSEVRGGCIVTAEHDLNSQQSSALRYISVTIDNNSIDTKVLSKFQSNQISARSQKLPNIVQKIFAGWINYLELNYDSLVQWLIQYQPPPLKLKFKRHQQIYRVLCATAHMILYWGLSVNAINEQQFQVTFNIWHNVIVDLMLKNQSAAIVAEPWQQFAITLQQIIATDSNIIAKDKESFEENGIHYVGFRRMVKDDCEYVLVADKIMSLVRKTLFETKKEIVADSNSILKELLEHGISKGYENKDGNGGTRKRYQKRIRINGHSIEMLTISKNALERAVNKFILQEE